MLCLWLGEDASDCDLNVVGVGLHHTKRKCGGSPWLTGERNEVVWKKIQDKVDEMLRSFVKNQHSPPM